MASWKWITAAAAVTLSAVPVSADSTASIFSMTTVPAWQMSSELIFQVSVPSAEIAPQRYSVVPLTAVMGLNQTTQVRGSVDIKGDLAIATDTSYVNIGGKDQIAYLCCDNMTDSFIDANTMFRSLMTQLPAAILLYSEVGNCCGLSSTDDLSYMNILTMVDMGDAAQAVNITQTSASTVRAEIIGNTTAANTSDTTNPGGNNSAIAMSILYSITGLVTVLFLVIIATGAVRAHRNPERYGPRSGHSGRPRQSRAKGIARAVLETLPIVKFGDPTPAKPDPSVELESVPDSHMDMTMEREPSEVQVHHLSTIPEDAETPKTPKTSKAPETSNISDTKAVDAETGVKSEPAAVKESVSGIGEATAAPASRDSSTAEDADHLGCSICTEDFSVGEDVRVLPCDHKFHPHCVDPWLVNVSGTCPLCRLDLRPHNEEAEASTSTAPPLESEGSTETAPETTAAASVASDSAAAAEPAEPTETTGRRRSSRLFDLHRLRHAPVEERIEALRRLRAENQAEPQEPLSGAAGGEDEHSRATLTKRLRDKFRIRTRPQSPNEPSNN